VRYEVRDGSKVLFWHDVRCGEVPLKTIFPNLFLIASSKNAWVEDRDKMTQFCGIFCLLNQFMIERWKVLVNFLRCCTLLKLEAKERIKCVRF
jgi:hypothetical protein